MSDTMSPHELNKKNVRVSFPDNADKFADLPVIYTERLILYPITLANLEDDSDGVVQGIYGLRSQQSVMRWSRVPVADTSPEQSRQWAKGRKEGCLKDPFFLIQLASDNAPRTTIGYTGVISQGPEFGYGLNPHYENRGYATEAVRGFVTAYWEFMPATSEPGVLMEAQRKPHDCIDAVFDLTNAPSRNVLQKCGFSKAGDHADHVNGSIRLGETWRLARPGTVWVADRDAEITADA